MQKTITTSSRETKRDASTQGAGDRKRIKQKSLSTILAKRLKDTDVVKAIPQQSQIPFKANDTTAKVSELEKTRETIVKNKNDLKLHKISSAMSSNTTDVSFAVTTKERVGKTLLAKKRNTFENKQKSLSGIFSKQIKDQVESNALSVVPKYDSDKSSKQDKCKTITEQPSISKNTKSIERINIKCKKIVNNYEKSDEISKFMHKSSEKSFPLFDHKPDIPVIGQRFVKPVNEPVFTEITFANLDIHPFMVSSSLQLTNCCSKNFTLTTISLPLQISNLKQNMNITKMTTVQQKAIPHIFSAKDILIRSQTGSGKTLAYALPIVEMLHKIEPKLSRNSGLSALVIVPTRELALQTYECFQKLIKVSKP